MTTLTISTDTTRSAELPLSDMNVQTLARLYHVPEHLFTAAYTNHDVVVGYHNVLRSTDVKGKISYRRLEK